MSKKTVRNFTFETNSSSVHSFVHIPEDIAIRWRNGEILIQFNDAENSSIAEDIDDENIIEISHVNGYGIYPGDPFSAYEGYFPYQMFIDEKIQRSWIDDGVWSCSLEENDDGSLLVEAMYMG